MKLPEIEALLSQEMEVVTGGNQDIPGSCTCDTGAAQGYGGSCTCSKGGAAQQSITSPPSPSCTCPSGAGQ